jgi:hypothetical protein
MTKPGWYDDPQDPELARWHDGDGWTEDRVRKADHRDGPPPPPGMRPAFQQPAFRPSSLPDPVRGKPAKKPLWKRAWFIGLLVFLGIAIGAAAGGGGDDDGPRVSTPGDTPATEDEPDANTDPQPADFQLEVVVLSQECFGSAGCNVTYELDITYLPTVPLEDDGEWTLVYEVTGGEDGPQIGSMTLRGDGSVTYQGETFISTAAAGSPLTATVTAVRQK